MWTSLAVFRKTARTQAAEGHVLDYAPVHVQEDARDVVRVLVRVLLLAERIVRPLAEVPAEVHVLVVPEPAPVVLGAVVDVDQDVADNALDVLVRATVLAVGAVPRAHLRADPVVLEPAPVDAQKAAEQDAAHAHRLAGLVARAVLLAADQAVLLAAFLDVQAAAVLVANIIALLNADRLVMWSAGRAV